MSVPYPARHRPAGPAELRMSEFLKSAALVIMGLTVIGAGVVVVFYG